MPDDTTLVELWRILVRRRLWILAALALGLLAGIALALTKVPVYEARAQLRIGQVAGTGPLEAPDVLVARLIAMHGEDVSTGVKRPKPFLKRAKVGAGVVELVAVGDTPADVISMLMRIFAEVRNQHDQIYDRDRQYLVESFNDMGSRRDALLRQLEDVSRLLEKLKESSPVQASLFLQEQVQIARSVQLIDVERVELAMKLSQRHTKPTELLGDIASPVKPSSPNVPLIVALWLVLGLFSGIMTAYIVEFAAGSRSTAG